MLGTLSGKGVLLYNRFNLPDIIAGTGYLRKGVSE